ncbi:hypothetical protein CHH78_06525 [Shouchella clausii]|uniref:YxeA family protein n=1 Tax=Shouchella clausii TaxID=79880 RepID=A0A268S132_SHOCL|nr:hypothetical protein BC8716_03110 [Shouchella clausii]PAD44471.1 hypothetical protein CHH54_02365 [Bacillus sp. 7520-S]PAD09757.1 hypothetical protein CHH76_07470 [Shouchella clausii]PAE84731.1 hypothetical protein CHH78_06525 [Shouchella clausii]PAE99160.1 hypothetical protein CHH71_00605 [Shouchella clausii]
MSKLKRRLAIAFSIGAILIIAGWLLFKDNVVVLKINPFVAVTDVYVAIEEDGTKNESGDYVYEIQGVDEHGQVRTVEFTASKNLREGAFLRLKTKKAFVDSWEEVQLEDIPDAIRTSF